MNDDCSDTLRFLPVAIDLRAKRCLVVGGGNVGTRKAITLARAGAVVTVVSPALSDELAQRIEAGQMRRLKDSFREGHLEGVFLAVAATDDDAQNATIVQLATRRGVLICDASSAERSGVIFGALLEKGDVAVAVFTGGRDPALARRTRDRIANLLGEERG